jgi:hypothetical protein
MRPTHVFLLAAALCCAGPAHSLSQPFSGNASYYGERLQGHRMANGRCRTALKSRNGGLLKSIFFRDLTADSLH